MTTQEKINLVNTIVTQYKELSAQTEGFSKFIGSIDGPFFDAIWKPFDSYAALVSDTIEDDNEFVQWFIWDNDCGKRAFKVTFKNGKSIKVKTVKDLIKVIETK
jgi:hypothetical protein